MNARLISYLVLLLSASTFLHAEATNQPKSPKEVVNDYFYFLENGKFVELMDLFDDNIQWIQPGQNILSKTYSGKEEVGKLFEQFMSLSQNTFKIDKVHSIMTNGEYVNAHISFSAYRCHYIGISIAMEGNDLMRVVNGKIVEVRLFSADQEAEDRFWDGRVY